jgi:hypothetical protein
MTSVRINIVQTRSIKMKQIYLIVALALVLALFFGQTGRVNAGSSLSPPQNEPVIPAASGEVLSTEQLVDDSDVVVVGTVSATSSRWNADHRLILTDAIVSVENVLKGDKNLRQAKVTQVGGQVGDMTLQVSGSSSFISREKTLLFLKNGLNGSFSIIGGKQGKHLIETEKINSKIKLDDFVSQVEQIVSKKGNSKSPTNQSTKPDPITQSLNAKTGTQSVTSQTLTPTISGIEPSTGSAGTGTRVRINGSYFGENQGDVTFYYRSGQPLISAPVLSWSDTSIVVTVPVGLINGYSATASSGPVQVITSSGISNSYQFGVTFSSLGVRWDGAPPLVHFRVNPSWVAGADTALQNAAQTWSDAGANFSFVYDGATRATSPGYDGVNEIIGSNMGPGILASTYSWWNGANNMCEFDTVFNTYYPWSTTGSGGAFDTQSIATHELGHALGLRDLYGNSGTPNDTAKVMYGYGSMALKRSLTAGDLAGILWIYPAAAPPPSPPVIGCNPSSLNFSGEKGGINPPDQILFIQNSGGGSLNWSVDAGNSWITVSPGSGVCGPGNNPVTLGINIGGIAAGDYSGSITISAAGATNSPVTIPVNLHVGAGVVVTGPFTTYKQDQWGGDPKKPGGARLLSDNFASIYPGGVTVGGGYTLTFNSASAVIAFLPQGGVPNVLKKSAVNPTKSDAGELAGQVLALRLNVDFSNAGITRSGLEALHVTSGKLAGKTVSEVLSLANGVLGGDKTLLPAGVSINDLKDIVKKINENYESGTHDRGYLQ